MRAGACKIPIDFYLCNWGTGRTDHPINCVDAAGAEDFCRWVGGRLPTAMEREYAAGGGAEARKYPWGSEEPGARVCWNRKKRDAQGDETGTCSVDSHPASVSKWGAYDLAGNVREWTSTVLGAYGSRDLRGGAWNVHLAFELEPSRGGSTARQNVAADLGFRCALAGVGE